MWFDNTVLLFQWMVIIVSLIVKRWKDNPPRVRSWHGWYKNDEPQMAKQLTWCTDGIQGLENESFSFRNWTFTLKVKQPFPTFGLHSSWLDAVYPRQRLRLHFQLWRHGCFQHDQKDQNRVGGFPGLRLQLRSFVTAPSAGRRSWLHWTCSILKVKLWSSYSEIQNPLKPRLSGKHVNKNSIKIKWNEPSTIKSKIDR